jgi:putative Mn2+ efflux pump MntP
MPLIGYVDGKSVFAWIEVAATWVTLLLLLLIGSKIIDQSLVLVVDHETANISRQIILTLAIATSVDALATGFSLTLLDINPFFTGTIIGVTTFIFSSLSGQKNSTLTSKFRQQHRSIRDSRRLKPQRVLSRLNICGGVTGLMAFRWLR